jgi:hypothetical protein
MGFPLWWALGLAQVMFFAMAAAMAVILFRHRPLRLPHGFGLWLLFLTWMLAGVFVLGAQVPNTLPGRGLGRLFGFSVWAGWYLAVTIVMVYVVNTSRQVPTLRIVRLLGWMFVVTAAFGIAAVLAPTFEFPSLVEILLPDRVTSTDFVQALVHPALATSSDFLGYSQPRPTAPFPYSNAWGNNIALFLPFFLYGWFGRDAGWRKKVGPFILMGAAIPITFSLNRGLWVSIGVAVAYAVVRLFLNGLIKPFVVLTMAVVIGGLAFLSSPLYETIQLRVETPHSNERRAGTATEVVQVTAEGSPFVGYGTTRTMRGSFASLAGGETPQCRQCAPPPLGTQGFMWRLILTTGFVGTALCLAFFGLHFLRRARGPAPLDIAACSTLLVAFICFFIYDSLGSALFTVMIVVGLMSRQSIGLERRSYRDVRF